MSVSRFPCLRRGRLCLRRNDGNMLVAGSGGGGLAGRGPPPRPGMVSGSEAGMTVREDFKRSGRKE